MNDLGDLRGIYLGLCANARHALDNGFLWGAIGCQDFGGKQAFAAL